MTPESLFRMFKAFLYPPKCLACGSLFRAARYSDTLNPKVSELNHKTVPIKFKQAVSGLLCPSCDTGCTPVEPPFCSTCGTPLNSSGENHTCETCIKTPPFFASARAFGIYENALMTLIHSLKYKKDMQVAKPLGEILFGALIRFFSGKEIDVALPVPLHPKKFRSRGFNQAFLLMRRWPDMIKSGHVGRLDFEIKTNVIERKTNTKSQTGLDGETRRSNVRNAFHLKNGSDVSDKNILVVDDVMTTGATVNECARTLKKGGAKEIYVLTLARTNYE